MADKVDPFDVEALESAVNDSATRVSAIWISFLIFSLYLLVAATTVTQRQLLLADPIKLPVLNIELPLWGFFFLAPILFVILHIYVLLQVLLLGRTTAAYNAAVARVQLSPEENISLRQRLANTLFAQIFAGSPRERDGFIGWLLRAIVWITLAIAPILILLAFQFSFLAYHSHIATWTHRLLILVELAAFFLIWPLALDAQKDFQWPKVRVDLKHWVALSWSFLGPYEPWHTGWPWLRQRPAPLMACLLFIIVSLSIATFPGEPHVNIFTGKPWNSVQCARSFLKQFELKGVKLNLQFDRLDLPLVHAVDEDKLAKIVEHSSERKLKPSESERTQDFRHRDFNCSDLSSADLRRVDLTGAHLVSATLNSTAFDGATLDSAELDGAWFINAQFVDASLDAAQLQGSDLDGAGLQGARLDGADLQGASLAGSQLQGATVRFAHFQGASLNSAQLQGSSFERTDLTGASLQAAELQGANFGTALLTAASLDGAELQGAWLKEANVDHTVLSNVWTWRADITTCDGALVAHQNGDAIIGFTKVSAQQKEPIPATVASITNLVENSVAKTLDSKLKAIVARRMRKGLVANSGNDDTSAIAKIWGDCERKASNTSQQKFDEERAGLLRDLACDARKNRGDIAAGLVRNWIADADDPPTVFSIQLARGLLGDDGKKCAATRDFDEETLDLLRAVAARPISAPALPK